MEENDKVLSNIAEAIIELPYMFKADGQLFYLYPPSLGVLLLIKMVYEQNGINESETTIELMRSVSKNKEFLALIVALCCYEDRKNAKMEYFTHKMTKTIMKLSDKDLVSLLLIINEWNTNITTFTKYLLLDKEHEYIKTIHEVKEKDSSSYTFNGKSIYGTLIDVMCERYGWTVDYVLWGISNINASMLMSDHITSMFLTKDEQKCVNIPRNRSNKIGMTKDKNQMIQFINSIKHG